MRTITLERRGDRASITVTAADHVLSRHDGDVLEMARVLGRLDIDEGEDLLVLGGRVGVGIDTLTRALGCPATAH